MDKVNTMKNNLEEKLLILLKKMRNEKIIENIKLVEIDNKELIEQGVLFDNEHTCYHDYSSLDDIITGLIVSADNYGIYLDGNFIGLISAFYQYYKDLSRLEISMSIRSDYRNKNIGKYCLSLIIYYYFLNTDIKSIHLSIREDNIKSIKLAHNLGFNKYPGYKCDNTFTDENGKVYNQVQYLLKKKDYIKNNKNKRENFILGDI